MQSSTFLLAIVVALVASATTTSAAFNWAPDFVSNFTATGGDVGWMAISSTDNMEYYELYMGSTVQFWVNLTAQSAYNDQQILVEVAQGACTAEAGGFSMTAGRSMSPLAQMTGTTTWNGYKCDVYTLNLGVVLITWYVTQISGYDVVVGYVEAQTPILPLIYDVALEVNYTNFLVANPAPSVFVYPALSNCTVESTDIDRPSRFAPTVTQRSPAPAMRRATPAAAAPSFIVDVDYTMSEFGITETLTGTMWSAVNGSQTVNVTATETGGGVNETEILVEYVSVGAEDYYEYVPASGTCSGGPLMGASVVYPVVPSTASGSGNVKTLDIVSATYVYDVSAVSSAFPASITVVGRAFFVPAYTVNSTVIDFNNWQLNPSAYPAGIFVPPPPCKGASPAAEKAVVKPVPDAGGETLAVASPPALPQVFSAKVDLMEGSAVSPGSLSYDGTTGMALYKVTEEGTEVHLLIRCDMKMAYTIYPTEKICDPTPTVCSTDGAFAIPSDATMVGKTDAAQSVWELDIGTDIYAWTLSANGTLDAISVFERYPIPPVAELNGAYAFSDWSMTTPPASTFAVPANCNNAETSKDGIPAVFGALTAATGAISTLRVAA